VNTALESPLLDRRTYKTSFFLLFFVLLLMLLCLFKFIVLKRALRAMVMLNLRSVLEVVGIDPEFAQNRAVEC
jgi:hypothetical protein